MFQDNLTTLAINHKNKIAMKKIVLTVICTFVGFAFSFAQSTIKELPQKAQDLIKANYNHLAIEKVDIDENNPEEMYTVKFEDDTKLDFNATGAITEIEGTERIPEALIPERIKNYLATEHKGLFAVEWEYENNEHEVELSNGTKLKFNDKGEILRLDEKVKEE